MEDAGGSAVGLPAAFRAGAGVQVRSRCPCLSAQPLTLRWPATTWGRTCSFSTSSPDPAQSKVRGCGGTCAPPHGPQNPSRNRQRAQSKYGRCETSRKGGLWKECPRENPAHEEPPARPWEEQASTAGSAQSLLSPLVLCDHCGSPLGSSWNTASPVCLVPGPHIATSPQAPRAKSSPSPTFPSLKVHVQNLVTWLDLIWPGPWVSGCRPRAQAGKHLA